MAHEIPYCRAAGSGNVAIPSGADTAVTMESAVQWAGTALWALSPNPARIVVPEAGIYSLSATLTWTGGGANTYCWTMFYVNGASRIGSLLISNTSTPRANISDILTLAANDYIELRANHNAGANVNVNVRTLSVALMGDYRSLAA